MPIALCCVPGIAMVVLVGIGVAAGGASLGAGLGGPLGLVIISLAALACPVSMGLMLLRRRGSNREVEAGYKTPDEMRRQNR